MDFFTKIWPIKFWIPRSRSRILSSGVPASEAESCRRSDAESCEVTQPFVVFNAEICILPHSRDSFSLITRLHSSIMHTARALTYLPACSVLGGCLLPGGVCSGGVSLLSGVSAPGEGGVCSGGCLLWGVWSRGVCSRGVSALGVMSAWGVSAPGGVCSGGIPACTEANTPHEQNSWHMPMKILPCPNFICGR